MSDRQSVGKRFVGVPEDDAKVEVALARLRELLHEIAACEGDEPSVTASVGELTSVATRDAIERLGSAVWAAAAEPAARPVTPDGGRDLVSLSWALIEPADAVQLGLAVDALVQAWSVDRVDFVTDAVAELAEIYGRRPETLVAEAIRLRGLLALGGDDELDHLAWVLGAGGERVVLDQPTYATYQRALDRILGVWPSPVDVSVTEHAYEPQRPQEPRNH